MKHGLSPLHHLHTRARDAMVGPASEQEARERKLFASTEFADLLARIQDTDDASGQEGRVRLMLAMLERVSLDPRDLEDSRAMLLAGHVVLRFFGVVSPVTWFEVERGGADHVQLVRAFERNSGGPLLRAAIRLSRLREPRRARLASAREDLILDRLRGLMQWPVLPRDGNGMVLFGISAFQKEEHAKAYDACIQQLNAKATALRTLRRQRLATLAGATCSNHANWHDLCLDLARAALIPMLKEQAAHA